MWRKQISVEGKLKKWEGNEKCKYLKFKIFGVCHIETVT